MVKLERINKVKAKLINLLESNPAIGVVGRIESWLKEDESRYPVSCTVSTVTDSMEGNIGIEDSWLFSSKGLRFAAGVALDLSELRPAGSDNGKGLIASGAPSFMKIYSSLNEVLRRGGKYKNGAIVCYLDANHPDILEFIRPTITISDVMAFVQSRNTVADVARDLPELLGKMVASDTPWVKRAIYVNDDPNSPDYLLNHPNLTDILYAVQTGTVWLAKKRWYDNEEKKTVTGAEIVENCKGKTLVSADSDSTYWLNDNIGYDIVAGKLNHSRYTRIYSQVCLEILLPSRGTCLLTHVNLGRVTLKNMRQAFRDSMRFLCELHGITGTDETSNFYLSHKVDKQVGLGVLGLANFLATQKVTYADFTNCLYDFVQMMKIADPHEFIQETINVKDRYTRKVYTIVSTLYDAFQDAAVIARKYKMQRAFTIAPTASCSFRYTDSEGYTTTPEISPPICHPVTKKTVRDSGTFGVQEYQYHPKVETAAEVGWDTYYKLVKAWQLLMESTRLAHSISFNIWETCPMDKDWLQDWLESPIVTTYYRMLVGQDFADKTTVNAGLDEELFSTDDDFFVPDDDTKETEAEHEFLKTLGKTVLVEDKPSQFCGLTPSDGCAACGE